MIAKKDLKHLYYYKGVCRNAYVAQWDEKTNKFYYIRYKFGGHALEEIRHPEDDDGFDLFIPLKEIDHNDIL